MTLIIGFEDNKMKIEAENVVQAIIKLLDITCVTTNNIEFEITKLKEDN